MVKRFQARRRAIRWWSAKRFAAKRFRVKARRRYAKWDRRYWRLTERGEQLVSLAGLERETLGCYRHKFED